MNTDQTPTPPPLDLTAVRSMVERMASAGILSFPTKITGHQLAALIARVEELEAEREDLMQKTQRIARGDQAFRDLGLEHRANCYALLMQDNENLNGGLHSSGLENVKLTARAEAAEAKIAVVRELHPESIAYPLLPDGTPDLNATPMGRVCLTCSDESIEGNLDDGEWTVEDGGNVFYPCPTIAALDGTA